MHNPVPDEPAIAECLTGWRVSGISPFGQRRPVPIILKATSLQHTTPELRRLGLVGACLAVGQGCWISLLVTYLVMDLGLSLAAAGLLFAIMQITGIPGRVGLGYLADRLDSGRRVLIAVAILSAVTSLLLAVTSTSWAEHPPLQDAPGSYVMEK